MTFVIADRYELGANIGSGGMSEVFAATDTLLGRDVAVKMLRTDLAKDQAFRERFRREAQNSGKLNHPNIVAVFDTGEVDREGISAPYIVMERVHGRTIRDIVLEEGTFSPADAASTLIPVCHALQASHEAGIIHRDIKPANIMITNTGAVKVMDFGIARALDDSTSAMTQTSAVIGTAQYLSPEQARGKPADARSDVYALGCVMYEMVTGHPPFEGESPFAVAYQHVQEDPIPPSEDISDLTPTAALNIDAVVLTAMAKHPADRYQSSADMADDLERLSRNAISRAARAHVDQPPSGAPTEVVAAGAVAGAGTAATAYDPAVAGSSVSGTSAAGSAPDRAPAAEDEPRRTPRWLTVIAVLLTLTVVGVAGAFTYDFVTNRSAATYVSIPDVVGLPEDQAVAELEELGLEVNVSDEANSDVEEGLVIRTNPAVGSEIQRSSTVTLTVSSGEEIIQVPDVTGMPLEDAARTLEEAGLQLNPTVREEPSDDIPVGEVIEQTPDATARVSVGSQVSLTVSSGAELVRVPILRGMNWSQAESNLTSLGFEISVDYVDSLEPEGNVLSVSGEGTERPRGSELTVQVSNGQMIPMPDITRQDVPAALAALRAAGWTGSDNALAVGEPVRTGALVDQGDIAWQSPSAGDPVRRDAVINIRLYEFNLTEFVP